MYAITQNNTHQNGFTMIELMITLAISSIIMIAIFTTFQYQQKSYGTQEEILVMQQNIRAATNLMARELRMATYSPVNKNGQITIATANQIEFTNEIGITGNPQTTQYDLYDAYQTSGNNDGVVNDLRRTVGGGGMPLAEHIDALEFVYFDNTGTLLPAPVMGGNLASIDTIQVSILARADHPDTQFLNTLDYFPASCPQAPPPVAANDACLVAGSAWDFDGIGNNTNRFNDNFRRRLLTTTIKLRN